MSETVTGSTTNNYRQNHGDGENNITGRSWAYVFTALLVMLCAMPAHVLAAVAFTNDEYYPARREPLYHHLGG